MSEPMITVRHPELVSLAARERANADLVRVAESLEEPVEYPDFKNFSGTQIIDYLDSYADCLEANASMDIIKYNRKLENKLLVATAKFECSNDAARYSACEGPNASEELCESIVEAVGYGECDSAEYDSLECVKTESD